MFLAPPWQALTPSQLLLSKQCTVLLRACWSNKGTESHSRPPLTWWSCKRNHFFLFLLKVAACDAKLWKLRTSSQDYRKYQITPCVILCQYYPTQFPPCSCLLNRPIHGQDWFGFGSNRTRPASVEWRAEGPKIDRRHQSIESVSSSNGVSSVRSVAEICKTSQKTAKIC